MDPRDIGSRTVVLELELAGPPTCNSSTGFLSYGFFMDSDRDPLTGLTDPALAGLGVDARVSAECDGTSGLFTSEAGSVSVGPGPGGSTLITITMQVGDLPAVEFDWLAFAHEDVNLTRLPQFPEHATWAIFERSLP